MTKKPNILFFFPDQHRGDWLGFRNDHLQTPTIDALAARGQVFRNALTPSPLCSPARACMALLQPYDRQPIRHNGHDVDPAQPNLYQALRQAGYQVLGCGKFDLLKGAMDWGEDGRHGIGPDALLHRLGFSDGIDNAGKHDCISAHSDGRAEPFQAFLRKHGLLDAHLADYQQRRGADRGSYLNTEPTPLPDFAYGDNWIAGNGLALLDAASDDAPWFLQVNFNGPHEPMDVTAAMRSRMAGRTMSPPVASSEYSAEEHQAIRANYAAMIENIDAHMRRFLDLLEQRGVLQDTVVIYASDHGEMLGDHDRWGKTVPYQPSVHVPLVMAGPGIAPRPAIEAWVDLTDVAATILHLADASPPDDASGCVLINGNFTTPKIVGLGTWRAIFDGTWKYVHNFDPQATRSVAGSFDPDRDAPAALYDLANDPYERNNIAAANAPLVARMRDALLAFATGDSSEVAS